MDAYLPPCILASCRDALPHRPPPLQVFRDRLQTLRRELNQPDSSKSRLNEITSLVRMQDEMQDLNYDAIDEENMDKIFQVWTTTPQPTSLSVSLTQPVPSAVHACTQVLQQQQEGLVRLTEIVMRDLQDTNLMLSSAMGP